LARLAIGYSERASGELRLGIRAAISELDLFASLEIISFMGNLFDGYDPASFFDEMFESPVQVRPHYQRLFERYTDLTLGDFDRKPMGEANPFLTQGLLSP